jgi:hypothetical protein
VFHGVWRQQQGAVIFRFLVRRSGDESLHVHYAGCSCTCNSTHFLASCRLQLC